MQSVRGHSKKKKKKKTSCWMDLILKLLMLGFRFRAVTRRAVCRECIGHICLLCQHQSHTRLYVKQIIMFQHFSFLYECWCFQFGRQMLCGLRMVPAGTFIFTDVSIFLAILIFKWNKTRFVNAIDIGKVNCLLEFQCEWLSDSVSMPMRLYRAIRCD